jgi:rhodanese-related sulfurtransferase
MQQINAPELAAWVADASRSQPVLLDVREPREHQICLIKGSVTMPMNTVPAHISELDSTAPIVCICHHGGRSMQVANFLEQNGFANVINLAGGIHAWAQLVDPSMPTY